MGTVAEDVPFDYWRTPRGIVGEQAAEQLPVRTPRWTHDGHAGTLKVTLIAARELRKGDISGLAAGQRIRTPTVPQDLNPEWNCTLCFSVEERHLDGVVEMWVWDDDRNALPEDAHGCDDLLGSLTLSLRDVIERGTIDVEEPLIGVKEGILTAQLTFLPV